ncbi:MAG: hypothetical protein H7839_17080 [Magnetococcus sp. YQC-5]
MLVFYRLSLHIACCCSFLFVFPLLAGCGVADAPQEKKFASILPLPGKQEVASQAPSPFQAPTPPVAGLDGRMTDALSEPEKPARQTNLPAKNDLAAPSPLAAPAAPLAAPAPFTGAKGENAIQTRENELPVPPAPSKDAPMPETIQAYAPPNAPLHLEQFKKKAEWAQNGMVRTLREESLHQEFRDQGRNDEKTEGDAKRPHRHHDLLGATAATAESALAKEEPRRREQESKQLARDLAAPLPKPSSFPNKTRNIIVPGLDAAPPAPPVLAKPAEASSAPPVLAKPAETTLLQADKSHSNSRETLQGIPFQEPNGHWANTHVPGDPTMRFLEAQLRQQSQLLVRWGYPDPTLPESMPHPVIQPSDLPWNSALGFTLHADRQGIEEPSRVRVQLSIQASHRQGGHRPSMKLALILDLRQHRTLPDTTLPRSLVMALSKAKQSGDRFLILALGAKGSLRIENEKVRHGPIHEFITRFLQQNQDNMAMDGPELNLAQAIALAQEETRLSDEPTATLGSSLILLASSALPPGEVKPLELAVHQSAIQGSPVSFISLGPPSDPMAVERIVAAGLGNRRLLTHADQAQALIERELLAASQLVARAIRVVFRLAPGVKLVDIPGSYPLATQEAARVRQTEQALDQQLAKRLGLEADRAEDDEGLRIVIPSFHAGNGHVILLDLVAPGAGPVVDLTVRYKDLVFMKNTIFRQTLQLTAHRESPGPLEQNVIKNELALRFALMLQQAGQKIAANQLSEAQSILTGFQTEFAAYRLLLPGWEQDPILQKDEAFLTRYLSSLHNRPPHQPQMRELTSAALRVAGFHKLIPGVNP